MDGRGDQRRTLAAHHGIDSGVDGIEGHPAVFGADLAIVKRSATTDIDEIDTVRWLRERARTEKARSHIQSTQRE